MPHHQRCADMGRCFEQPVAGHLRHVNYTLLVQYGFPSNTTLSYTFDDLSTYNLTANYEIPCWVSKKNYHVVIHDLGDNHTTALIKVIVSPRVLLLLCIPWYFSIPHFKIAFQKIRERHLEFAQWREAWYATPKSMEMDV